MRVENTGLVGLAEGGVALVQFIPEIRLAGQLAAPAVDHLGDLAGPTDLLPLLQYLSVEICPAFSLAVYNRTFPCMESNYPYAIKNLRGASKIPLVGGFGCPSLFFMA